MPKNFLQYSHLKLLTIILLWKEIKHFKPCCPFWILSPGFHPSCRMMSSHLCKNDWNTKNVSSKNTWSTWTRKSNGVQRYPAWVWVGPALGLRAKKFKIWSHGTKIFGSKISLHKVIQVPWRYFVGFWNQNSFWGLTGSQRTDSRFCTISRAKKWNWFCVIKK